MSNGWRRRHGASDRRRPRIAGQHVRSLHDFHGEAARIDPDATAFGMRRDHYVAMAAARWEPGDVDAARLQRAWVSRFERRVSPLSAPGGYINFLAPSDFGRVRDFYGPDNARRLAEIKAQYDPLDTFRSASCRLGVAEARSRVDAA